MKKNEAFYKKRCIFKGGILSLILNERPVGSGLWGVIDNPLSKALTTPFYGFIDKQWKLHAPTLKSHMYKKKKQLKNSQ